MNKLETVKMTQNEAFQSICEKVENIIKTNMVWDNEISLSGAAGTGKTYLTTKLVEKLNKDFHITITAPTHKALQVLRQNLSLYDLDDIDTKTLQSFLNLRLVTDYDKGIQRFEPLKSKDKDITKTDLLIVDESSMVSQGLYEYIITAIESSRIKAVLYVGDEYQLLPVDNQNNKVFDIRNKFKLEKIVRQAKDSYIINIATKARNIIKSQEYVSVKEFFNDDMFKDKIEFFYTEKDFYNDFCTPENWAKRDKVIASFTNKSVDKHNKVIRDFFWGSNNKTDIPNFLAADKVIFQQANIIDEKVVHQNSDTVELSYAKKMFEETLKVNFWDCKDVYNKPFKVIDPDSEERFKIVLNKLAQDAKSEKNYKKRTEKWRLFYSIKELFTSVKYTYASTIHKLQGSTYKSVYIDLREVEKMNDKDMMYRLLYVAVTRASKNIKVLLPSSKDDSLSTYQDNILNSIDSQFKNLGLNL